MLLPAHVAVKTVLFFVLLKSGIMEVDYLDLAWLFSVSLVDVDHLFSKPIYHPKRNPFKTHFLHKNWEALIAISLLLMLFRPVLFLGIGILLHLFLDWIYCKRVKV